MDGGAASGALPHAEFGRGPISRTIVPPFTMSLCSNHGLFNGLPFSVADWMYLFAAETFFGRDRKDLSPRQVQLDFIEDRAPDVVHRTAGTDREEAHGAQHIPGRLLSVVFIAAEASGPALNQIFMMSRTRRCVIHGSPA